MIIQDKLGDAQSPTKERKVIVGDGVSILEPTSKKVNDINEPVGQAE